MGTATAPLTRLRVLQALSNAEAAHARALRAASHVNLVGDCDSAQLRTALQDFSELPYGLGQVGQLIDHSCNADC